MRRYLLPLGFTACLTAPTLDTADTGMVKTIPENPTHDRHIQPIWNAFCGDCHTEYNEGSLRLSDAYDNTVAVRAEDVPRMFLVTPFEPQNSYLWLKILGSHLENGGQGASMPIGEQVLLPKDKHLIELWIQQGALR